MGKKRRPLQWLRDASAEEIGEALLAVDQVKAARVVAYMASRASSEIDTATENLQANLEADPLGTIGHALIGMSRRR